MATYKVIQDIEAEDKLLGPFSLRQFIYLIIVAVSLFIGYRLVLTAWFLALPLVPLIVFFGLLAAPLGGSQSSEVWLLARIRFVIKPKKRIWDQSGIKDLVTITAPKKIQRILTNNLSQAEVRSRLEALANTIDSRGWAVKNVNVNMFTQPVYAAPSVETSDRLVAPTTPLQNEATTDIQPADDILDEKNNRTAQYLDQMIHASSKTHRDQLVAQMQQASQGDVAGVGQAAAQAPPPDYWFMNPGAGPVIQPQTTTNDGTAFQPTSVVAPAMPPMPAPVTPQAPLPLTEEQLLERIRAKRQHQPQSFSHMRTIKPMSEQLAEAAAAPPPAPVAPTLPPPVTPPPNPAILELANNDDLNVATIARQANKVQEQQGNDGEVVISLH